MSKNGSKINKKRLLRWVEKFDRVPILVVGDLMLDRTLRGSVERISPEAPVPVVNVKEETSTAGGAGNVVFNLAALGASPTLVSVRGNDEPGQRIVRDFENRGLAFHRIYVDLGIPTITKTRISAGQQQIVRVDQEKKDSISNKVFKEIMNGIRGQIPESKGVIISDYGKGLVTPAVIAHTLKLAHRRKLSVTVDPKVEHFMRYKGVDCITPNSKEAVEGMRVLAPKTDAQFKELGRKIVKKLRCECLLLTRGGKGMQVFAKKGAYAHIPAHAQEVFDVTGAGDTVVATYTLARAVGASHIDSAQIANLAASIVVSKLGTACVSQKELATAIRRVRLG